MSMSRKGTPADNSPIETFHSTLKSETFYLDDIYRTTNAHVIQIVEEYINYYNNIRIQTKLNSQSPVQYRQLAAKPMRCFCLLFLNFFDILHHFLNIGRIYVIVFVHDPALLIDQIKVCPVNDLIGSCGLLNNRLKLLPCKSFDYFLCIPRQHMPIRFIVRKLMDVRF